MTSRDTKGVRKKRTITIPPSRARPSTGPGRGRPSVFDIDLSEAAPRLGAKMDRWGAVLAAVGLCAFAAALVGYVLFPALATLTDASAVTWMAEGP